MTITLFGIPNCDTVRKARRFLDGLNLGYTFVDMKTTAIDPQLLAAASQALGFSKVLNRSSATFRALSADDQALAASETGALQLLQRYPTLIKRPLVVAGDRFLVGFDEAALRKLSETPA